MKNLVIAAILLVLLTIGATLAVVRLTSPPSVTTQPVALDNQQIVIDARKSGLGPCSAGQDHGCEFYADKLRSAGDADGAQYLEANLAVAKYLGSNPTYYQSKAAFSENKVQRHDLLVIGEVLAGQGTSETINAFLYLARHQDTKSFLSGAPLPDLGEPTKSSDP